MPAFLRWSSHRFQIAPAPASAAGVRRCQEVGALDMSMHQRFLSPLRDHVVGWALGIAERIEDLCG